MLDPSVADRLIYAKYQLNARKRELATPTKFAAGEAVIRFHNALETFMLALADHLELPRVWAEFHKYPARISKDRQPFRHTAIVNEVTHYRDEAKHFGRRPDYQHVYELAQRIDRVFEDNAQQYLGTSFADVRLSETVQHDATKARVRRAEEARAVDGSVAHGS